MSVPLRAARDLSRPVDLAHLARQTMGNADLEREVLRLFLKQSERVLAKMADPSGNTAELAHALVGSARGIGAWQVAAEAEALEALARSGGDGMEAIRALTDSVAAANAFIRSLG